MKKVFELLTVFFFLMVSCTSDVIPDYQPQVVVEGWIENGYAPVVRLYSTVPVSTNANSQEDLLTNTIVDANVTLTCDGKTYILHNVKDGKYYPSSIYTSNDLVGVVGKTYNLSIETHDGTKLEATTTIPYQPQIIKTGIEQYLSYGKYNLYATIEDDLSQHRYYKVFVNLDQKRLEEYHSSFLGESDNRLFEKVNPKIPIYGFTKSKKESNQVYFISGQDVAVKLCCVDSIAYNYWCEYAKMLELSRNPIFTYQHNLPTNIKGGLGYWFGYGSQRFEISIP